MAAFSGRRQHRARLLDGSSTALEELAALAARTVADRCAVVLRRGSGEPRVSAFAGAVRADASDQETVERGRAESLRAAQAAMTGQQPVLENVPGRSSMAVPLHLRGQSVGALVLAVLGEGRRYGPADLGAAQELARRASIAIDNVRLLAEAQESVRAREDLLAIVSHDLRNPLGVVLASSALLLKSSLPPEPPGKEGRARRQIEAIERAGNRMNRLIRDLLDFAAIQAGHLSVSSHPREVGTMLREVLDALEPLAAAKTIKLVDGTPENGGLSISCDHDRVIQLFSNVVGNAVKFTPEGGTVILRAEPDDAMVRFAVADNGPGIPPRSSRTSSTAITRHAGGIATESALASRSRGASSRRTGDESGSKVRPRQKHTENRAEVEGEALSFSLSQRLNNNVHLCALSARRPTPGSESSNVEHVGFGAQRYGRPARQRRSWCARDAAQRDRADRHARAGEPPLR